MDRTQKEQVLGEIKEAFANVASVVIADYRGIRVPVVTTMREDFRKAGCHYRVTQELALSRSRSRARRWSRCRA